MSEAGRKRWWRAVAVLIGGGGTLAGVGVGFTRLAAESPAPLVQVGQQAPGVGTPALQPFQAAPVPVPTLSPMPGMPAHAPKVAEVPAVAPGVQAPAALPPVVPVAPVTPVAPAIPLPPIPQTGPVIPAGGTFPPPDVSLPAPATPSVPAPAVPAVPAIPAAPAIPPLPGVGGPTLPTPPAVPAIPTPSVGVPGVPAPAVPAVPAVPSVTPAVPATPSVPAVPPLIEVTPPAPPVKVAEPVKPIIPAQPSSGLPPVKGGNTVKPDNVGSPSGPTVPGVPMLPGVPAIPMGVAPVVPPPVEVPQTPKLPVGPAINVPGMPPVYPVERTRPPEPEKNLFPVPNTPVVPTPGESTMIPLSRSAAVAVIGGMLMAAPKPAPAAAPPVVPNPVAAVAPITPVQVDDKDTAELKKQLEESNRKLTAIQDQLKTLTEMLVGKKDEKGFTLPSDRGIVAELKDLKDKLAAIEKDLTNMKTQTSLRPATPTPSTPIVDPKAGKGTVRIVNEYPVQISIVVNGTSYRVAPSKALDVEVLAGDFSYQLLDAGGNVTKSTIKEKETVTLRIK